MLHLIGTLTGLGVMLYFVVNGPRWLFFLGLIPGYGAAWFAHFFIEKNRPATFDYPLWSFIGDYKMIALMLTGRMRSEVENTRRKNVD